MKRKKRIAAISLAATCALAGAAAGISQSTAATKSKTAASQGIRHSASGFPGGPHGGFGGPGGPGSRAVHEVEQVLNKAGTAYISQTVDNGEITAVDASAGTITLKEGTSTVTYATPTITIPSGATVTLDGASSSLEKLKTATTPRSPPPRKARPCSRQTPRSRRETAATATGARRRAWRADRLPRAKAERRTRLQTGSRRPCATTRASARAQARR
ncbi:MAG TPA: hypothetical protein VN618_15285 [Solirubrobacteraceae bacterium]|nr:hypothetical protein [Solirubrobacteraceae bacterium]